MIGKTLGHYQVTSQLGKGGMGEVYRAHDTKLNRDVALKVLPSEFANDAERMARFKREAQLLASLNHTSIAAIYGLEESGDVRALVMELAEGPTLADRISQGPIPLDEALHIARQIAEALEAAHEKGIIHRDLKPANIKVTPEGTVKLLDFGLAKALEGEAAVADASQSPTLSLAATKAGVILGTAAYMSPEQARGSTVDKRCDIWSFGVVLFEMLTGKQLFAGETISDTLAAVLRSDIDWNMLSGGTPASIRTLLRRCLTKDRKDRLRDIGEARVAISEYLANPAGTAVQDTSAAAGGHKLRGRFAWAVAVVILLAALAVLGFLHFREVPVEVPDLRLQVITPPSSEPTNLAISPDGRSLVFVASAEGLRRLYLRSLDKVTAQPLAGTEGASLPFWKPDGRSIGFFADSKLKRIDIAGGPPQSLANASGGYGGTWNRDDVIVFAPSYSEPLYRVSASGGDPIAVTKLDPPRRTRQVHPHFLPDGRRFLFYSWGSDWGIYLGSLDTSETRLVTKADSQAVYASPGSLFFMRQGFLYAQDFDPNQGELTGNPVRIADSVAVISGGFRGGFSASETGMLAYRQAGPDLRRLIWYDRSGKETGTLGAADEHYLYDPELSPDGRNVLVNRHFQGNYDIYMIDAGTGRSNRFTFDSALERWAVWSRDGSQVVFTSERTNMGDLYRKSSGGGREELFCESPLIKYPMDWSPDGRHFLYVQGDPTTFLDIWVKPLFGEGKPFEFEKTPFEEGDCQFSPDGRWVAYQSNQSGTFEIWVKAFPDTGYKRQITSGGGIEARWNSNGKELFYIARDGKMMAVPIQTSGQSLQQGAPIELFQTRIVDGGDPAVHPKHQYAVTRDGQRFLINTIVDQPTAAPITIVTNWARALKK